MWFRMGDGRRGRERDVVVRVLCRGGRAFWKRWKGFMLVLVLCCS